MNTYIDPEYYQSADDVKGVDSETLREAHKNAKEIYNFCGGHWRAHRMETAMRVIDSELASREV